MATCCTFSSISLLFHTVPFSISASCKPSSSSNFLSTARAHIISEPHRSLPLQIIRCLRANVEAAFLETNAGVDADLSETKKAAEGVGRGSNVILFYSDHHDVPVSATEKPPVDKCRATRLLLEGDSSLEKIIVTLPAPLATSEELCLVYEERCIQSILNEDWNESKLQPISFPWSGELVTRSRASAGGAVAAMHIVMLGLRLVAASVSGHGFSSRIDGFPLIPSGVFNDVAVAASVALQNYPEICNAKNPILVIDLDVHQRNDTIRLFENESRVVTFNLHGSNNAPWRTDMRIDNDSGLLDCTGDDYYLAVLSNRLQQLFDFCDPGLVFFQAGVDALSEDISGKLSMTRQGLLHRNNIVYTACFTRKVPLVITMGSGYSKPLEASIEAHADVYRAAALRYGTNPAEP
eukprot:c11595_g1_i1 orf=109-1332(+)